MATKVGPSTVSYGIGVQNRYSAFLEDEDSFALSNIVKRPTNEHPPANKQKNHVSSAKSSATKSSQRSDASSNQQNKRQDSQQKSAPPQVNGQQAKGGDMRRQNRDGRPVAQQNQANGGGSQLARTQANRNRNYTHDGSATTNGSQRFVRNQHNGTQQHQSDNGGQQQKNREDRVNFNGRPTRPNNLRPGNRHRVQIDDKRSGQQADGQQVNGHLVSNDEEKARRQQKRLNNLRFKDPEKRERRSQATNGGVDSQEKANDQNDDKSTDQRGQRNRRDLDKSRARPRRNNGEPNGDTDRRENRRDRPNRQRGDMSQAENHSKQEKPKPIPNFSDKSDFPSLAS